MSTIVADNLLIALYLLVWIATFVWYHWRRHKFDAGSAIIGSYVVYAVFSILSLNDDLFSIQYDPLRLFPFIYLYVMLMIALSPTIHHHFHHVQQLGEPNTRILKPICWLLIICAIIQIPDIIQGFGDGIVKLFTDASAGLEAYNEHAEEAVDAGTAIRNIPAIIFNALYDISIFLAFYYLSRKDRSIIFTIGTLFSAFIGLLIPIMKGERSIVITNLLTIILGYMLFHEYISKKIARWFRWVGIVALFLVLLPVAAITVSRFGERNAGVTGYVSWYVGQENLYFNNCAMDAGGIRYGDRTMNLFKRLFDSSVPRNYTERRYKYSNLKIDDYYFTTFVGDFCLDFGPILAFVIFVVFNLWVLSNTSPHEGCLKLHQLLLIFFTACICIQGGMTLFAYSDGANLKILVTLLLYAYLRYHDLLLEKFPLLKHLSDSSQ